MKFYKASVNLFTESVCFSPRHENEVHVLHIKGGRNEMS